MKYFDKFIRILGESDKKALKESLELLFLKEEDAEGFLD